MEDNGRAESVDGVSSLFNIIYNGPKFNSVGSGFTINIENSRVIFDITVSVEGKLITYFINCSWFHKKNSFLQQFLWSQILTGGKGGVAPPCPWICF